jgi:NhaP-type Na+/H+ or K+/H+ antiporter
MALALTACVAALLLFMVSRINLLRAAAAAPALLVAVGAAFSIAGGTIKAPALPVDLIARLGEAGLAALVFVSAAQLRISRFARACPSSFRLTLGGGPIFLVLSSLSAFILLPQLSLHAALLVGGALMLNGAAFDRRAVTSAPAPAAVKAAVRIESAGAIALGAPIAILLAGNAVAPGSGATAGPLLDASYAILKGFALGGAAGLFAARILERRKGWGPGRAAVVGGVVAVMAAPLLGANPVIAAGAAGLLWGEDTRSPNSVRLGMRRLVEFAVAPAAYFLFGLALAPRAIEGDLLSTLYALAAVSIMRVGPRFALLHGSRLPKESQAFLAWFGGAPGAASALFLLSLADDPMIVDHDGVLTIGALAVTAGVIAARLTSQPLASHFLRRSASARRRRALAG